MKIDRWVRFATMGVLAILITVVIVYSAIAFLGPDIGGQDQLTDKPQTHPPF